MPGISDDERATLHRAVHQIDEIHQLVSRLAVYLPVLEAFKRGGPLAARTAARRIPL